MESGKNRLKLLKQFIWCIQIVYLFAVFSWLIESYFSKKTVSYTPYFLKSGIVWVVSLLFLFIDFVVINKTKNQIKSWFRPVIMGCLAALVLFFGDTIGFILSIIILSAKIAVSKKGDWKLHRTDISLVSCVAVLEGLGILLLIHERGTWWFQTSVISSWVIDVLLVGVLILMSKKEIWDDIDDLSLLRPAFSVMGIISAILLVTATILYNLKDTIDGALVDACKEAFSAYSLLPSFEVVRGTLEKGVLLFVASAFIFGVWCYGFLYRDSKLRALYAVLTTVLAVYCGLWVYPVLYLMVAIAITLVKYETTDFNVFIVEVKKLPYGILGITLAVLMAVSFFAADRVVTSKEEYDKEQKEAVQQAAYLKIKPLEIDVDPSVIKDGVKEGLVSSIDLYEVREDDTQIAGWAFIEDEIAGDEEICLCLMSKENGKIYQIYTEKDERMDVAELFRELDYKYCGYYSRLANLELEYGKYEVLYYVRTNGRNGRLIDSGDVIELKSYEDYQIDYQKEQEKLQEEYDKTVPEKFKIEDECPTVEDANIIYTIEDCEEDDEYIKLRGWIIAEGYTMPRHGFDIALKNAETDDAYELPVSYIDRHDVTEVYGNDGANYDHCGFYALINKNEIPAGWYYLHFNTESDIGYTWTGTDYLFIFKDTDE